jgi:hypothetical protein
MHTLCQEDLQVFHVYDECNDIFRDITVTSLTLQAFLPDLRADKCIQFCPVWILVPSLLFLFHTATLYVRNPEINLYPYFIVYIFSVLVIQLQNMMKIPF